MKRKTAPTKNALQKKRKPGPKKIGSGKKPLKFPKPRWPLIWAPSLGPLNQDTAFALVSQTLAGATVDVYTSSGTLVLAGTAVATGTETLVALTRQLEPGTQVIAYQTLQSIRSAASAPIIVNHDYVTHHYDRYRTGWNPRERLLSPSVVRNCFGFICKHPVDDAVRAQPLYVESHAVPGFGVRNLLLVATENNSLYAFDADSSNSADPWLWHRNLIDTSRGEQSVQAADVGGCDSQLGVTATPVVDRTTGTLYASCIAKRTVSTLPGSSQVGIYFKVHAIDLATGADRPGSPAIISAATVRFNQDGSLVHFNAIWQGNRPGLLLDRGVLYVAFGSHCFDAGDYHGWIVAFSAETPGLPGFLQQVGVFNASPKVSAGSHQACGIWQGGFGLAGDSAGGIFCVTGNGDTTRPNYGNSVLKLRVPSMPADTQWTRQWGQPGDIPVPADYDGDGITDLAVYRPSEGRWYVISSLNNQDANLVWGVATDIPVPSDYSGGGKATPAVWRPADGTWWIWGVATQQWGQQGDVPVPADYDGTGKAQIAVWRPSTGQWWIQGRAPVQWGLQGDVPVPADYDGTGKAQMAIWRPTTGEWWIVGRPQPIQWGLPGDNPVPFDFDEDGKVDLAVWRPSTGEWWVIPSSGAPAFNRQWGVNGERPAPGRYSASGTRPGMMVWRPSTGVWRFAGSDRRMEVVDWFMPKDSPSWNGSDADLGSAGAMLIPDNAAAKKLLVVAGKPEYLYLVDRSNMGHFDPVRDHVVQTVTYGEPPTPPNIPRKSGTVGGPAYFKGANGSYVYLGVNFAPTAAYRMLSTGNLDPIPTKTAQSVPSTAPIPAVSSDGSMAGSGVLWQVVHPAGSPAPQVLTLQAFDAENLGLLFSQSYGGWQPRPAHFGGNSFQVPTVIKGRVYTGSQEAVYVWGINPLSFCLILDPFPVMLGKRIRLTVLALDSRGNDLAGIVKIQTYRPDGIIRFPTNKPTSVVLRGKKKPPPEPDLILPTGTVSVTGFPPVDIDFGF